jgi:hypothetical protein
MFSVIFVCCVSRQKEIKIKKIYFVVLEAIDREREGGRVPGMGRCP